MRLLALKVSDLRLREVINISDGRRLGLIKDIDIDVENGRISALILPGPARLLGFWGREDEIVIPWERVVKIGTDVILVEAPSEAWTRPPYRR
ncbi:YlmC/YmxH family sporulation protein [Ammonifex thiophilus]|uniref:YlmC/YmxH family sporulation protein n=1 Tax=Ammonifex thiophilus TaxID=444093 RepID=UPI001F0C9FD5